MSDLHSAIETGHYAQKQIFSRDRLIAGPTRDGSASP